MFESKRITFLILSMLSAIVVFSNFSLIAEGKTSRYKEPISDPDFHVDIYIQDKAFQGTTLFFDLHKPIRPRIIEIDMEGRIVWEYNVPENLKQRINPGPDVEWLPNNNILVIFPLEGVYEINRQGDIVWSYNDHKISHDADRLTNGNTLVVFGGNDKKSDAQVKEIDRNGKIIWAWYAKNFFTKPPYQDISWQGWTHTNAACRLPNDNTLISLRNFNMVVEVNPNRSVVRTIGEGIFYSQHDPEVLSNGNILIANQNIPPMGLQGYPNANSIRDKQPGWHQAIELDPKTNKIVWQSFRFLGRDLPVRDANRLPNGNTLITTSSRLVEVTQQGEIVWELKVKLRVTQKGERQISAFYKAERIAPH